MADDFMADVRKMIKKGEGSIPHMYLDTRAKVTVGVGNMLPTVASATSLPFVLRRGGEEADKRKIEADFDTVTRQKKGKLAARYRKFTKLVLTEDEIDKLLDKRLDKFISRLQADFPGFDGFPDKARMGLIDMAFNLGNKGLLRKFPTFTRAALDQDWTSCARECQRRGIGKWRNKETQELFLQSVEPGSIESDSSEEAPEE